MMFLNKIANYTVDTISQLKLAFYNPEPHPEDPPQQGVLPDSLIIVWVFFGVPLSFFVGSIYTAYKKLWRWFWAYMIIGGLPVGIFSIAVYLG